MRMILSIFAVTLLATGCASFQEAYHTDEDFGKNSTATWESQIAYPERPYAKTTPEGMAGITSEQVMDVHNNTFGTPPKEGGVFSLGLME